jgi:biopolymer transport protein ExbD
MSDWKVRHEGSPKATEGLTHEEAVQGLLDGRWETTDEVWGPSDTNWIAFENHPRFAEIAADIEPPPSRPHEDETRLDFNPLIDVCLVLLVFFILTTTYASLQKIIEAADLTSEDAGGVRVIEDREVADTMVRVGLLMRGDAVVVQVEGKDVASAPKSALAGKDEDDKQQLKQFNRDLVTKLQSFSGAAKRRKVLLEHEKKVPHGFVVAVQDAAKTARMEGVLFLLPPQKAP